MTVTTGTTTQGRDRETHDVVVVGGGAAGLAAAKVLLRSRRSVLVLDTREPRNGPADGVHNLLGLEGIGPHELQARGRAEVAAYGGTVSDARATTARREGDRFVVGVEGGAEVVARRLLVTSGLLDELPALPGVRERWGSTVLHCPFCHGWEVRGRRIGVLATGPNAAHQALMFAELSDDVVLLTHEAPPDATSRELLAAAGVRVLDAAVVGLEGEPLDGARLADGAFLPLDALVVAPYMRAESVVLDALGITAVAHPSGMGEHYPSEAPGRTTVPGLWVAGNVGDVTAQVSGAAATGVLAGAAIHGELLQADLAQRVEQIRLVDA